MTDAVEHVLEITVRGDADLRERLDAELYLSDSSGSVTREEGEVFVVTAWFADEHSRRRALTRLTHLAGLEIRSEDRKPLDWLEHYEQSLVAMKIGERFIVAPDERLLDEAGDRISLVVPQERAFGTGSHATTSMCLELLEGVAGRRRRGLDIGTGSGILAIAMKKLGCAAVFAFDNDPETLGVVRDNLRRNRMEPSSVPHFIAGPEAVSGAGFDLVTMNIIPEVIIPLLPQVGPLLAEGCSVILSGILEERAADVITAAKEQGLHLDADRRIGEWWAGRFVVSEW